MVKAYVFIETRVGSSTNLIRILQNNMSVVSASRVTGPYDVIAIVQADNLNKVHKLIIEQIHQVRGVLRTTTSVAIG